MPKANDSFITTLKIAHLEWGTHRHTYTRDRIYGEGYIQIPRHIAKSLEIYNSNQDIEIIEYTCNSTDGFLENMVIKASGSSTRGDVYAKQFQGSGNLKALGDWYHHISAQEGDQVGILWVSPSEIQISKI